MGSEMLSYSDLLKLPLRGRVKIYTVGFSEQLRLFSLLDSDTQSDV